VLGGVGAGQKMFPIDSHQQPSTRDVFELYYEI